MPCTTEYIDYVCAQLEGAGALYTKKAFGEYYVYVDEKAAIMACDNICFVKKVPELEELMAEAECGFPYPGAKEHYILDIDHKDHAVKVARILAQVLPFPQSKSKATKKAKK